MIMDMGRHEALSGNKGEILIMQLMNKRFGNKSYRELVALYSVLVDSGVKFWAGFTVTGHPYGWELAVNTVCRPPWICPEKVIEPSKRIFPDTSYTTGVSSYEEGESGLALSKWQKEKEKETVCVSVCDYSWLIWGKSVYSQAPSVTFIVFHTGNVFFIIPSIFYSFHANKVWPKISDCKRNFIEFT